MIHVMRLDPEPFEKIKNKVKTIEMRLNDAKRAGLKKGDVIEFINIDTDDTLQVVVLDIHSYKDFKELYAHHDKIALGYQEGEIASYKDMHKYYSKEDIKTYGVLGIEIKVLDY